MGSVQTRLLYEHLGICRQSARRVFHHRQFIKSQSAMKCYLMVLVLMAVVAEGQRHRRPRVHRGHVVGPVGFNLPDLTKLPSTQFECEEDQRQSTQKRFCRLQSKCLKKWKGHRSAKQNQRIQICKSQAHLQLLMSKIEGVQML